MGRLGRSSALVGLVVLWSIAGVVPTAASGGPSPVTRTPPYSFGCEHEWYTRDGYSSYPNDPSACRFPSESARHGRLDAIEHPSLVGCLFFIVPCPTTAQIGDVVGVAIPDGEGTRITAVAEVRDISDVRVPLLFPLTACFSMLDTIGRAYLGFGCRPVPAGGSATATTTFADAPTLRYLAVFLKGTGSAMVDKITYELR